MRSTIIFLVLAFAVQLCYGSSFIKVRCSGTPLYRGRVDSIVSPGIVSGHVHKIVGGSNFSPALSTQSPEQVYDDMMASPCTTCNVADVDLSAYWHPDLYYEWPNKSLSLVPNGGLTIYYLTRRGDDVNQKWEPFPRGFRMVSGNPFRRTFNSNSNADKAISFACLDGGPETNDFPTATRFCRSGLRLQVHFPQCWDGRLDTPNHKDHLAFPIERPDGGNCPSSHPRRLPNLFFEAFYSVDKFPHGAAPNGDGTQRFVLANGDRSGYGFHGDFLNGWDVDVLRRVLEDPSCDSTRTNNGDNVRACAPLTNHVQETPAGACTLNRPMFLTENLGIFHPMSKLPGCNPITGKNENAQICSAAPSATEKAPVEVRFHLRTEAGEYLTCSEDAKIPLKASAINANKLTFNEIFIAKPYPGGFSSITHEGGVNRNLGANGGSLGNVIMCDKGSPSDWEAFQFVNQANGKVAIISKRTGRYLTVNGDKTIGFNTATTVGSAQLFTRIAPTGGSVY